MSHPGPDPTSPYDPYAGQVPPQPYAGQVPGYPGADYPTAYPAGYGTPVAPTSGYPGGYGMAGLDPNAPYGYDRTTGAPLSDKSKLVAGLLQLIPGFFFILGGIGRLYAGNTRLGIVQIVTSIIAWISLACAAVLFIPIVLTFAAWLWFVVDGIVMLAGRPLDGNGRPLRA